MKLGKGEPGLQKAFAPHPFGPQPRWPRLLPSSHTSFPCQSPRPPAQRRHFPLQPRGSSSFLPAAHHFPAPAPACLLRQEPWRTFRDTAGPFSPAFLQKETPHPHRNHTYGGGCLQIIRVLLQILPISVGQRKDSVSGYQFRALLVLESFGVWLCYLCFCSFSPFTPCPK